MRKKVFQILAITVAVFSSCKDDNDNPQNEPVKVNKIIVDPNGVKWFATAKGIISYNYGIINYNSDKNNVEGIYVNDVAYEKSAFGDEVWYGTNTGVNVASYDVDAITAATSYISDSSEILPGAVTAVAIGDSSKRYFGTKQGLSIFKGSLWDTFYGQKHNEILQAYSVTSIASDKNGWVYATTDGGGIVNFKYTDAVSGATTYFMPWANGLKSDSVFSVTIVNDTCQWYGTLRGASYHIGHFTKENWTHYSREDGLICDTVYAIAVDNNKTTWFGTHLGVSAFNGTSWTSYTTKDGLIDNKINTIAIDTDGTIWFGTDKGVCHYVNKKFIKIQL